jgi:hypothetical protein
MTDSQAPQTLGCEQCWPDSAEAAATAALKFAHSLIDESYDIVWIRHCGDCGQRYLSVMTERIDCSGGNDPQFRMRLPLAIDEAERLIRLGGALSDNVLNALGPDRRSLCDDFPASGPRRAYWHTGLFVGPHD